MLRTLKSFRYAINGFRTALFEEPNFLIEVLIGIIALAGAWLLHLTRTETIFIVLCVGLVIAAELVNTAIEDLANKVEPNTDPTIKKIKDLMAAFVLVVSTTALVVGIFIFYPYIAALVTV